MIEQLTLRQLQIEAARALAGLKATNNNMSKFNKLAHHDSQAWYKAVIQWYVTEYGALPSQCEPGKSIKLILNNV